MDGLSDLRNFIDLGGVFILALALLYGWFKKLDKIEDGLTKILALLTILTKQLTKFNDVEDVLGNKKEVVEKTLNSSIKKL